MCFSAHRHVRQFSVSRVCGGCVGAISLLSVRQRLRRACVSATRSRAREGAEAERTAHGLCKTGGGGGDPPMSAEVHFEALFLNVFFSMLFQMLFLRLRTLFWRFWASILATLGSFFGACIYLGSFLKIALPCRRELKNQGPGVTEIAQKSNKKCVWLRDCFGNTCACGPSGSRIPCRSRHKRNRGRICLRNSLQPKGAPPASSAARPSNSHGAHP